MCVSGCVFVFVVKSLWLCAVVVRCGCVLWVCLCVCHCVYVIVFVVVCVVGVCCGCALWLCAVGVSLCL